MIRRKLTKNQKNKVRELIERDSFFYSQLVHEYIKKNSKGCTRVAITEAFEYLKAEIKSPFSDSSDKVIIGMNYKDLENKIIIGKNIHGINGLVFYSEPEL